VKCPRCKKEANVENEMFCAHPLCPLPLPKTRAALTKQPAGFLDDLTLDTMRELVGKSEPADVEDVIRMAMSIAYNQGMIDANFKQIDRNNVALRKARA
jgi:hypothetical protein